MDHLIALATSPFVAFLALLAIAAVIFTAVAERVRAEVIRRDAIALAETDADWLDDQPAEVRPTATSPAVERIRDLIAANEAEHIDDEWKEWSV